MSTDTNTTGSSIRDGDRQVHIRQDDNGKVEVDYDIFAARPAMKPTQDGERCPVCGGAAISLEDGLHCVSGPGLCVRYVRHETAAQKVVVRAALPCDVKVVEYRGENVLKNEPSAELPGHMTRVDPPEPSVTFPCRAMRP